MKDQPSNFTSLALTRREAFWRALGCGLAVAALPAAELGPAQTAAAEESRFTPEDDYPFFGCAPDAIDPAG